MMQDYQQELGAIRDLLKKNPNGMSVTDISRALKKNKNTIGRYLDILLISGQVDMRTYGMAKVYSLSQRVPLSAMLSYSKDLIMVLDGESRITDINNNFLTLLHLTREETLGKNITYLQSPEVDVHELLDITKPGRDESGNTITFQIKGSGERIFQAKSVPTVFDDGQQGLTIILEDVTEHILAERGIRESEERFRMMAENIRDGLIIMENGKVVYTNNRISTITGYPMEELWAMEPLTIIPAEYRDELKQRFMDIESHPETPTTLQMWIPRKDGEKRYVYLRFSAVRHGTTIYMFVIFTDITELKNQEAKVRESEQRFRMMAENIQDGLIIVENDEIVFTNRRINEIIGYSEQEMAEIGLHGTLVIEDVTEIAAASIIPHSEKSKIEEIVRSVDPDSGTPGEFRVWVRHKDGTPRLIQGKVTATRQGGITSIYITIADITGFAEREKALRERIDALQDLMH
jgi:PAS domain S-box-containing protein